MPHERSPSELEELLRRFDALKAEASKLLKQIAAAREEDEEMAAQLPKPFGKRLITGFEEIDSPRRGFRSRGWAASTASD